MAPPRKVPTMSSSKPAAAITKKLSAKEQQLLNKMFHPVIYCSRIPKIKFDMAGLAQELKEKLVTVAIISLDKAYCPYSNYPVAAALLTEDGSIIVGVNVENASYGGTICAERSAVVRAVAEGHRKFKGIVIATNSLKPASPCGLCRQFMFEFGDFPVVLVSGKSDECTVTSIKDLLPGGFGPHSLTEYEAERNAHGQSS